MTAQFVDGVDAVRQLLDVFAHEGVDPSTPGARRSIRRAPAGCSRTHRSATTVNDSTRRLPADRILRSAMVTVTYGGEKRPAPEPEAAPEDATADTAEGTEE
ncbi:MAG: hypothetical protein ACLU1W_10710 [Collinsella sp.]